MIEEEDPKESKKSQNDKNLFPTDFLFHFCLQLGQKWPYLKHLVKSYKIFQIRKNHFFGVFSHTKPPKTARRSQFRDIISQQEKNIFKFRKKPLKLHNPHFQIELYQFKIRILP